MSTPNGLPIPPSSPPFPVPASFASLSYWPNAAWATVLVLVNAAASTLIAIFHATVHAGTVVGCTLAWLLIRIYTVVAWPLVRVLALLQFLLSPVTYTLSYAVAPVLYFLNFLTKLRPLYTYLGSAAFVGIVAGLTLKYASGHILVLLHLQDGDEDDSAKGAAHETQKGLNQWPSIPEPQKQKPSRPSLLQGSVNSEAVTDDVWQWLDEFNPRQPVVTDDDGHINEGTTILTNPGHCPGGLLSLTIMEESSSE